MEVIPDLLNSCAVHLLQKENDLAVSGEGYNLFNILSKGDDELMHSSVLASLLDPNGSHKQGTLFLDLFLGNLPNVLLDSKSTKVICEKAIGEIVLKGMDSTGGRIDIYLEDKNGHHILIENKWNAGDQSCQLIRYHNYDPDALLLYLTRDGHEPSSESRGTLLPEKDYFCISYTGEIMNWLQDCLTVVAEKPVLYSAIKSYLNFINKLNMSNVDDYCYNAVVSSLDTVNAAFEISKSLKAVKIKAQEFFWEELYRRLEEDGLHPEYCCQHGVNNIKKFKEAIHDYVYSNASREIYRRYGIRVKLGQYDGRDVYFAIFVNINIYLPLYVEGDFKYNKEKSVHFTKESGWAELDKGYQYQNMAWRYPDGVRYDFTAFTSPLMRKLAIGDASLVNIVHDEFIGNVQSIKDKLSK